MPPSDGVVRVEGVKDLRKRLRRAGDDLSDMKDLNQEIAQSIVAKSRSKVPTRDRNLVGTLRGSGTKTNVTVRLGNKRYPYGNAIHWGRNRWPNSTATATPSGRRPHSSVIAKRPVIMETARSMDAEIQKKYADYLDKVINKK